LAVLGQENALRDLQRFARLAEERVGPDGDLRNAAQEMLIAQAQGLGQLAQLSDHWPANLIVDLGGVGRLGLDEPPRPREAHRHDAAKTSRRSSHAYLFSNAAGAGFASARRRTTNSRSFSAPIAVRVSP